MEFRQEELRDNDSNFENKEEMEEVECNEIDTSIETHFMKLEEILRNRNNRENILQHASENLETYKQILFDQTTTLKTIQEKNQHLSLKIKYENQWRDKIIKRMIQTYDKLKIVTFSTNIIKCIITYCENNQEKINQGKQQLMEQISFNKEKDALKYEQLSHEDELLAKKIENEKLDTIKYEKQFEIENNESYNKKCSKKQNINDLKSKIDEFKIEHQLIEKQTNAAVLEKELILKEIDVTNIKLNTLDESIKKDKMEFDEKHISLNRSIEINNNSINDLEKKSDVIKEEINNENNILEKINKDKTEQNQKLSNLEIKCNSCNEEIDKLKEILDSEVKEYNTKNAGLKQEINEKENKIIEIKNKNSTLKEEHHALVNQIMSLESNNNQLDINIAKLKDEIKEKHFSFIKQEVNCEEIVTKLKTDIEKKDLNINIENEIKLLENEIAKLNVEHENEKTEYDSISNEATSKEIDLNLEIDKLNETKQVLQTDINEAKAKIREVLQNIEEELRRIQDENETKIKNLEEQTNIYQKETERVRQVNDEKRKQEHDRLMEIDNNLQFKISEYQTKKQKLDKELAVRFKELGKIREKKEMEMKERREQEFLVEAENEMMNTDVTIVENPSTKKKISTNKKIQLNKDDLPNLKIPDSKYSSTSFDDSSVCSLDSTSSLQMKLKKQKRPRQTLPAKMYTDTQKSLDEIFNSLRDTRDDHAETAVKKPKTRGTQKTRKTVF